WDTHGFAFPHLKEKLFPPTDRAVAALLDDLHENGLLESTLIVMAGRGRRAPQITPPRRPSKRPGRRRRAGAEPRRAAGAGARGVGCGAERWSARRTRSAVTPRATRRRRRTWRRRSTIPSAFPRR